MPCTNLLKVFLVSLKFRKARVASQSSVTWKFFRCRIQAAISLYAQASKTTAVTISLFPSYAPSPSGHAPNPPPLFETSFLSTSKYVRKSLTLPSVHSAIFIPYVCLSAKLIDNMLRYVNGDKQYQFHDLTVDVEPGHVYSKTGQLRFRTWTNKGKIIRLHSFIPATVITMRER